MSIKINIAITPVGVAAVALAQAHQEQQSNSGNPGAGKARRIKHEWKIPGTHSLMETIRTEADAKAVVVKRFVARCLMVKRLVE